LELSCNNSGSERIILVVWEVPDELTVVFAVPGADLWPELAKRFVLVRIPSPSPDEEA